ncbi:hypothetical protein [Romboutsia sp.]|uniref:hypothetical protein n=1 Tax=Romboutsia sp. TaxID=1965302 RepID=UPI002C5C27D7|nr:hypothetical protein [Romboutsia sp.]HSQ90016.1 hypothetical protein [Romboutsia sp.]
MIKLINITDYICGGTFDILYNIKMVKKLIDSCDILLNPKYKVDIIMFDSVRDTIAIKLKKIVYSI